MSLPGTRKDRANSIINRAWANMGLPFDAPMVDEKKGGIIDIEALLMITFLLMESDRMITDVPAWIVRFSDIINHQKLKSLFRLAPEKHRKTIAEKLNWAPFGLVPKAFRKVFDIQVLPTSEITETIEIRKGKLNSPDHVAQSSFMLKNRLLYGTGFRADLVTITHIRNLKGSGKELAELLCTNNSTVSRLLNDLRACRFLNQDNERVSVADSYPGMFISSQSIWNLCEILDAEEFRSDELKKATYESLNFKHDRFGTQIAGTGI
jgi:hypothetical protein